MTSNPPTGAYLLTATRGEQVVTTIIEDRIANYHAAFVWVFQHTNAGYVVTMERIT